MPQSRRQLIDQALQDAFTLADLKRLAKYELDVNLDRVVNTSQPLANVVFDLCDWAENHDRFDELAVAAAAARPRNKLLARAASMGETRPRLSVAAGATVVPEIRLGDAAVEEPMAVGLERLVDANIPTLDIAVLAAGILMAEARVCRMEVNGAGQGTGFLVGPDLVLTNRHVVERSVASANEVLTCRFDFKLLANGNVLSGRVVGLAQQWLVDSSPPTADEWRGKPDASLPAADELDYALVRLGQRVGEEPRLAGAAAGGVPRGWFVIPVAGQCPVLAAGQPLVVVHHPNSEPMKVSINTRGVLSINVNQTRVRYSNNTEGGSSGSPVFTLDFRLAALHHMGDPTHDPAAALARYNQGVPIGAIRELMDLRGVGQLLGA